MRTTFILRVIFGILASMVTASAATRPNILFIIFDDWGWQHAGAYECSWVKTPNFDRVASEGVLFSNAFTSNPKCSPCRASILTGRNTWQLKEAVSHNGLFPAEFEVYPDLLESAGYFVGLTGKGWGPGDFRTLAKRIRNPAGPGFNEAKCAPPASGISGNDYGGNFEAFLQQRPKDKPFCFWMGFREPHRGYERDSGVRMGKDLAEVTVPGYLPDVAVVRGDLADYAIEVEWADTFIGKALATLETSGELENTLVVVTSDHGMPFPYVKGQIHEDGFRLPLAMRWGNRIKPGRVVEDFINLRDLAPTFMELAGLAPHPQMTGRSLTNILLSTQSGWIEDRNEMLVGKERHDLGRPHDQGYPVRALRIRDFLYVQNFHPERWPGGNPETDFGNCDPGPTKELLKSLGGKYYELSFGKRPPEELYDLRTDPEGVSNLAGDPGHQDTRESMRQRMMTLLEEDRDPRARGDAAMLESYPYVGGRGKSYDTWLKTQADPPGESGNSVSAELAPFTPASDLQGDWAMEVNTNLPNVLILGDSISIGYTRGVRRLLQGTANVFRPMKRGDRQPDNCGDTRIGLDNIDAWLGTNRWDVIHFNWGLWDICYRDPQAKTQGNRDKVNGTLSVSPEEFERNLEQLVARLQATGARLIWGSTTVVPEGETGRFVGDEVKYNAIAARVMQQHDIATDDLHTLTRSFAGKYSSGGGNVHYTAEGYDQLAKQVAGEIRAGLPR